MMAKFIDSRAFQRLRNIKQLGTTYFVWAGASHNRFEHCIGVAHLARLMATRLQRGQPELNITDRDVECVTLAGLCHDLGHGPWSHVWDGMLIPHILPESKWTHEQGSEMMLDFLIADKRIEISMEDVEFIKALIAGDMARCPHEKAYLFDIVANKRNGLDVDKFDYIQRDSLAIGEAIKLQISRLIESARVIGDQICYEYKDLDKVFEVFQTRHKLHKAWYNHKTAKAIEYMIVDALTLAEPHLKIAEQIRDPKKFLWLTDNLMQDIQRSEDPNLRPAQEVFNRITNRDLYKCVDTQWVKWEERDAYKQLVTEQHIWQCAREAYDQLSEVERVEMDDAWGEDGLSIEDLTVEDIKVEHSTLHYGMKEENPLNHVRFYSKHTPNKCERADDGTYSMLRPLVFAEVLLRVFTGKRQFHGIIQKGYRRIPEFAAPQSTPHTVTMKLAEGEGLREANVEPLTAVDADPPLHVEDGTSASETLTEPSSSQPLSRYASGMSVDRTPLAALSTAATAGSNSLAQSPEITDKSPTFLSPRASSSNLHGPASTSVKASSRRITTENRFMTVNANHGSPIKSSSKPHSRKRDRSEVEDGAVIDLSVSPGRTTRSTMRTEPMLPGDREVSPSPVPRKLQRHA